MDKLAANLRNFFGPDATQVWSYWRDHERAQRSIELYENVLVQLREDLELESSKRGTLVRVRSNEVTQIKDEMQSKSDERIKVNRELKQQEDKIDTFLGRMDVRIRALFTNSPGVGEIEELINEHKKQVDKFDKELDKISNDLSQAVYKQNAAKDPLEDLEFAINHLLEEISSCKLRSENMVNKINQLIVQECLQGGPLHLESMILNGLKPLQLDTFCELYLEIHDKGIDLISQPLAPVEVPPVNFEKNIEKGYSKRKIPVKANIPMKGAGSHHRKVKRGKSSVWRSFDVNFSGKINTAFKFKQQIWDKSAGQKAMRKLAVESFHKGRNEELKGLEKEYEILKHTLLHQAATLFKLIT